MDVSALLLDLTAFMLEEIKANQGVARFGCQFQSAKRCVPFMRAI
jgi:hypothetical protein